MDPDRAPSPFPPPRAPTWGLTGTLTLLAASLLPAQEIGVDDFRISAMGGSGSTAYTAIYSSVAYNPLADEYLVVWLGDTDSGAGDDHYQIFGQRLDVTTGAEVGPDDFVIVSLGGPFGSAPLAWVTVAHGSGQDEYLVVWSAITGLGNGSDYEIFCRRVAADGTPLGVALQISHMHDPDQPQNESQFTATEPAVAYDPLADEFLVVWAGDHGVGGLVDEEVEIFGQRVSAATGLEIGTDDLRISDVGGTGSTFSDARSPDVAYNASDDEYLVVWAADDPDAGAADNELEIHGQRLTSLGGELGANDFRITSHGPAAHTGYSAVEPAVAHSPDHSEYLVVFSAPEAWSQPLGPGLEIYAQRLDGSGSKVGGALRLSDVGGLAELAFDADTPDVAYAPASQRWIVTFRADDNVGGQIDGEREIHLQEVEAATGLEVGANDARVSDMGPTGSNQYQASLPTVACTAGPDCLVVWRGDDNVGGLVNDEHEIFGQRWASALPPEIFADGFESGDTAEWSASVP